MCAMSVLGVLFGTTFDQDFAVKFAREVENAVYGAVQSLAVHIVNCEILEGAFITANYKCMYSHVCVKMANPQQLSFSDQM